MNLPINLSNAIRHFQISCSHIYSSPIDLGHLNLRDQLQSNFFIIKSYKAKSSTGFSDRISNDLSFFNISILCKMFFEIGIRQLIIKSSHKHFILNRVVHMIFELVQFPIMSCLIKVVRSFYLLIRVITGFSYALSALRIFFVALFMLIARLVRSIIVSRSFSSITSVVS